MAKMTYKNGSIEFDPEMIKLLTNENTAKFVIDSVDRLVKLEEIKSETRREAFKDGTKSLMKIADTISKGLDMFFDGDIKQETVVEDNRSPEEIEKFIKENYTFAKEEIPANK